MIRDLNPFGKYAAAGMQDEQVLIAIPGASKRHDAGQSAGAIGFRLSE